MKKLLLLLLPLLVFGDSKSVDPFEQMDRLFEMQMKHMQQMQKEMDEMFKIFQDSTAQKAKMPIIYSSGGMMSSGLKDKGDHYELNIKISKAAKTDLDVKSKDGILSVKVTQSNSIDKNSTNSVYKSQSVSSYMQSFTLPKDADANNIKQKVDGDKIIITIPKKEQK